MATAPTKRRPPSPGPISISSSSHLKPLLWRHAASGLLCLWVVPSSVAGEPSASTPQPSGAAAGASAAISRASGSIQLALYGDLQQSIWTESGLLGGSRSLRERGRLPTAGLELRWLEGKWVWSVLAEGVRGERRYEGYTNTGQRLSLDSGVRAGRFQASIEWELLAGWRLGARAQAERVHRVLGSTATVQGYPERFDDLVVSAGLMRSWAGPMGDGWQVEGWIGAGPPGRMWVQLPGADPARLRLGTSRAASTGVQWTSEPFGTRGGDGGWQLRFRLAHGGKITEAGPAHPITRNGLLVGGAAQPRTKQEETRLGVALVRSWAH